MTHETLKLAIQYLIETKVISSDRFNAIYQWIHKRLVKKGVNSVTYELSDTQHITVTRDTITYCYSVEIITLKSCQVATQPTVPEPTLANAVPVQLSLALNFEVDSQKADEYFRKHQKVRRPRLVVDNTYKPQLEFNFDAPADNVFNLHDFRKNANSKCNSVHVVGNTLLVKLRI